ncbi:hypothetical protein M8C21_024482, partial [Ambrosia artemisiifolia]
MTLFPSAQIWRDERTHATGPPSLSNPLADPTHANLSGESVSMKVEAIRGMMPRDRRGFDSSSVVILSDHLYTAHHIRIFKYAREAGTMSFLWTLAFGLGFVGFADAIISVPFETF